VVSSSTRKCLSSVFLASFLLASSLPAVASTEFDTTTSKSSVKPLLQVSTIVQKETYTQTIRKQMQWIATPVKPNVSLESTPEKSELTSSNPVTVAENTTQPTKNAQQTTKKAQQPVKSNTKPVQVAAVPKQQVSRSNSSTLVDNALSLKGVPYVFGGTSKKGFDCSGYTQYVFKGSGISLPRTSQEQFNVGSSIKKDQLQTGDLVFFTTYAKGPTHVGIYVGGGNFVHASNSGVRTTSLSDSYYTSRYVGARRVN